MVDVDIDKPRTPTSEVTSVTPAGPVPSVVAGPGSTGLTETRGIPRSRTLLSNPCNAAWSTIYCPAGHPFHVDANIGNYDAASAEQARCRTLASLHARVG